MTDLERGVTVRIPETAWNDLVLRFRIASILSCYGMLNMGVFVWLLMWLGARVPPWGLALYTLGGPAWMAVSTLGLYDWLWTGQSPLRLLYAARFIPKATLAYGAYQIALMVGLVRSVSSGVEERAPEDAQVGWIFVRLGVYMMLAGAGMAWMHGSRRVRQRTQL